MHTWFKSYSNWLILLIVGGLFSIFRLLCSCVWWCLSVCPLLGLGLPGAKHRYFLCIEKNHTKKREHWKICTEFSQVIIIHLFSGVYIQQVFGGNIGQNKLHDKGTICSIPKTYIKHTDIATSRLNRLRGWFSKTIYLSIKK